MFDKNYNSEKTLKKMAKVMALVAKIFFIIDCLTAFIVFCIDVEEFWWIALTILGGGLTVFGCTLFFAHLLYGFGELVGNTGRASGGAEPKTEADIKDIEKEITDLPKI